VTGVPFFVLDRKYGISGAQPTESFSQALAQAWAERNPLTVLSGNNDDGATCGPDGCN
jgi:predicted DsbA family dithiol-disulfide isomerase